MTEAQQAVDTTASRPPGPPSSRLYLALESVVVVLGFHAYLLFGRPHIAVDLAVVALTTLLIVLLFRRRGETLASLGISGRRLAWRTALILLPIVLLMVALAFVSRSLWPPEPSELFPGIVIALLSYPLWGFLQQLFYLGFFYRGLSRSGLDDRVAAPVAGLVYGLSHVPNWPLTLATVPMGIAFAFVYRKSPGLIPIGIAHGIGGALAIYVMGLDLDIGAGFGTR